LIEGDEYLICADDSKLIQRYVLALLYYSTGGDSWLSCGKNDASCTGGTPYLASVSECRWSGSRCNADDCITEIEFEANNLVGTIPSELGNLNDLEILSLEQGDLSLTIPDALGSLSSLRILDLDFNKITGTIPEAIYGLTELEQLDVNSNLMTGTISESIGNLVNLRLFQVYENLMTGTVPTEIGNLNQLVIAEFFNNTFTGTMPQEICDNRQPQGSIAGLTSDCFPFPVPQIECPCCTGCALF